MKFNYSLVIEGTDDPNFFAFYSPDLQGFTGSGTSIEDCLARAELAMKEHVAMLKDANLPVPRSNEDPKLIIDNVGREAPAA